MTSGLVYRLFLVCFLLQLINSMDNTQNNPQRPADAKPPSADASQAPILTSVPGVPATKERTPFREKGRDRRLIDPGLPVSILLYHS
jgi:hypothetical protein